MLKKIGYDKYKIIDKTLLVPISKILPSGHGYFYFINIII